MAVAPVKHAEHEEPQKFLPFCCEIDTIKRKGVHVTRLNDPRYAVYEDHMYTWGRSEAEAEAWASKRLSLLYHARDGAAVWVTFRRVYIDKVDGFREIKHASALRSKPKRQVTKTPSARRIPLQTAMDDLPLFRTTVK